jgi:hypothetical protein
MRNPASDPAAAAVHYRTSRCSPILIAVACLLATSIGPMLPATSAAATGDLVGTAHFSQQCGGFQGIGVGVTFDGTNLWYSCAESTPDLLRADPHTGQVTASYTIGGGIGALAYDATHNVIYAGWGNGSNEGNIYSIQLDANRNITGSAVKFMAPGAIVCGLDDGLAYDGSNDTLYVSDDCSTTIHHYDTSGNELGSFPWAGSGCYNSGLALGDQLIFEGADGCSTVYVVDKSASQTVKYQFSTAVGGDPNFRDEGLSCDTSSFPGKDVMWSKEAYAPERAHAFEVPAGSCGVGGLPAAPVRIAVLGDSYASGEGTYSTDSSKLPVDYFGGEEGGSSYPQTVVAGFNGDSASADDHCHRSPIAAGPLLGAAQPDFVACSGATIHEVVSGSGKNHEKGPQLKILSPADSEVLLSSSGDSLDFAGVLGECIEMWFHPASDERCKHKIDQEINSLPTVMGELRDKLLNPIMSMTHGATVVLIGYPHLFPDGGNDHCNGITAQRQRYLNTATDKLDEAMEALASTYVGPGRVQFADTRPTFHGHAICGDSYPYINDLQLTTGDPLLPPDNCPLDYGAGNGIMSLVCSQSFHPDSWGYIAEALMLSKMIQLPANVPLFALVHALCDNPFPSGYCAGLPR